MNKVLFINNFTKYSSSWFFIFGPFSCSTWYLDFFFVCLFEWGFMSLQQFFSYIMTTSFSGGGSRSARIEPLTLLGQVTGTLYHIEVECTLFCKRIKKGANSACSGDRLQWSVRINYLYHSATQAPWYLVQNNSFAKRMEHLFPNLHSIIPCIINNDNMKRNLPTIMRQSVVSPNANLFFFPFKFFFAIKPLDIVLQKKYVHQH